MSMIINLFTNYLVHYPTPICNCLQHACNENLHRICNYLHVYDNNLQTICNYLHFLFIPLIFILTLPHPNIHYLHVYDNNLQTTCITYTFFIPWSLSYLEIRTSFPAFSPKTCWGPLQKSAPPSRAQPPCTGSLPLPSFGPAHPSTGCPQSCRPG